MNKDNVSEAAIVIRNLMINDLPCFQNGRSNGTISIRNLEVERGTVLGLVSSIDSNVRVFIQLLAGNVQAKEGEVLLFGSRPAPSRRDVGLVSYRFDLYDELTVHENLILLGKLGSVDNNFLQKQIRHILNTLEIGKSANIRYRNLTLPEKRLALLAQALLKEPALILIENILFGLDMFQTGGIIKTLDKIINSGSREKTYVIQTSFYDKDLFSLFTHQAIVSDEKLGNLRIQKNRIEEVQIEA